MCLVRPGWRIENKANFALIKVLCPKSHTHMSDQQPQGNAELLKELLHYQMPFGKYKGQLIRALPISYLEWFAQKGFPAGKLGMLLQTMYEIRLNGLDYLLDGLRKG